MKYKKVENLEKICYNQRWMKGKGGTNMRINLRKMILFIIIFIFVLIFFQTISFATGDILNPDSYKTTLKYDDATYIFNKGGQVLKI